MRVVYVLAALAAIIVVATSVLVGIDAVTVDDAKGLMLILGLPVVVLLSFAVGVLLSNPKGKQGWDLVDPTPPAKAESSPPSPPPTSAPNDR